MDENQWLADRFEEQVSGERVYDINKDGVAHYGMYADWIEDLRKIAGPAIVKDMYRGSEAYLQTWERAYGVKTDACSTAANKHTVRFFKTRITPGKSWWSVVRTAGQPHRRLGQRFTYCTLGGPVTVSFTSSGKVASVKRT